MDTFIFNIDSRNRDLTKYNLDSEFEYDFTTSNNGKLKNVVEINVSSIELPNTSHFFNSTKDNTSFVIDDTTILIEDGNYNSDDIVSAINNKILDAAITTVEFSVNHITGNIIITVTADHIFDFTNTTDYKSLGESLGFIDSIFTITAADVEKKSDEVPNVIGEHYYLLQINDYGHINHNDKKYMSKIMLLNPKYEMTFDSKSRFVTKSYKFKQPTNIDKLEIKIVDYLNNVIDLKGVQFSFTIEFKVINNNVLKKYHELSFLSGDLLELMLHDNMLEFYDRENNNKNLKIGKTLMDNMQKINIKEQNDINKVDIDKVKSFNFNY